MTKIKNTYRVALTGGNFMIDEMNACLPLQTDGGCPKDVSGLPSSRKICQIEIPLEASLKMQKDKL